MIEYIYRYMFYIYIYKQCTMNTHIYVYIYNINITNKYTYYLSIYIITPPPSTHLQPSLAHVVFFTTSYA